MTGSDHHPNDTKVPSRCIPHFPWFIQKNMINQQYLSIPCWIFISRWFTSINLTAVTSSQDSGCRSQTHPAEEDRQKFDLLHVLDCFGACLLVSLHGYSLANEWGNTKNVIRDSCIISTRNSKSRLYNPLCRSDGRLIGRSVGRSVCTTLHSLRSRAIYASLPLPKCLIGHFWSRTRKGN